MNRLSETFRKALEATRDKFYLEIIDTLVNYSKGEGYRLAGTEGEYNTVKYIMDIYREIGLESIKLQKVPIDRWIFKEGYLEDLDKGLKYPVVSYAGCIGGEVEGRIVYVGRGFKNSYIGKDLKGAIALIDMDYNRVHSQVIPAMEAFQNGAEAVLITHMGRSGTSYVYRDVFYTCDGDCEDGLGPIAYIPAEYAYEIIDRGDGRYRLYLDIEVSKGYGYNLIGEFRGEEDYEIILGAHHDAYFNGVLDNASGVAFILTLAKLYRDLDRLNKYTLKLISFTAEEYGRRNTLYDYLIGSHHYFASLSDDELDRIILFINADVVGYRDGPLSILSTPDYMETLNNVLNSVGKYIKEGVYIGYKPSIWLDMWPAVVRGVGSISFTNTAGYDYYEKYYHTPMDDIKIFSREKFRSYVALGYTLIYYLYNLDYPDYTPRYFIEDYIKSIDLKLLDDVDADYRGIFDRLRVYSSRYDDAVRYINRFGRHISRYRWRGALKMLNRVRRMLYRELYRLGLEYPTVKEPTYRLEYLQDILNRLKLIRYALDKRDYKRVNRYIEELNMLKWARFFSKETYRWILARILKDDYWANGILPGYMDLYPLYEYIGMPDILSKLCEDIWNKAFEQYRSEVNKVLEILDETASYLKGLYEWLLNITT